MSKKRRKNRFQTPLRDKKAPKRSIRAIDLSLENSILSCLYLPTTPVTVGDLSLLLPKKNRQGDHIKVAIDHLLSKQIVRKTGKNHLILNKRIPLYQGILEKNPKGFGFVIETVPYLNAELLTKDPYISISAMGPAYHGDKVLIRITKTRNNGRPEGVVIKVLAHGRDTIAGFYFPQTQGGIVYPEDPHFPLQITVTNNTLKLNPGDAVIVRLNRDNRPTDNLSGNVIELLGSPDKIDVQMRLVIEKFSLPHTFSHQALEEAEKIPETFSAAENRVDLRKYNHVTIDGETAKDFDDAVCVQKTRNGFNLYVSIADVSYFVQPGSHLDREAYARGTSIYFPGRVIPMLPEKLSNNICSLVPGKDRFTVTAILKFDRNGKLLKKHFVRSVIRSHHRFTYTTVKQILIDKDPSVRRSHKPFLTQLKWAHELATALHSQRKKKGSIGFTIPEAQISLTNDGEIAKIHTIERNFAHQIIEEFMLAANEAVALKFSENQCQALYRIHEPPDPEKVADFCSFAKTLNISLSQTTNRPEWFAEIIEQCKGTTTEYLVNNLLLRTMKQARYSPDNAGHFGLASSNYTHFTSPIRRYPDLLVHRELINTILQTPGSQNLNKKQQYLQDRSVFLSTRERVAIRAARDMNERLKVRYMKRHIGENFAATISGVNDFAMFIELKNLSISGSIRLKDLKDDYYLHDTKHYRLIGEISGTIYQIGDSIQVTLVDVDFQLSRINFIPSIAPGNTI